MPSYVLVDKGQSAIVHKHPDRTVLGQLAWIECMNAAATIPLGTPKLWADTFTAQELKRIYEHATGVTLNAYGTSLAQACHDMALRLPDSVVNAAEVRAQYLTVMDGDKHTYQYRPGAQTPEQFSPREFEPTPLKATRNEAEEKRAQAYQPNYNSGAPAAPAGGTGGANPFVHVPPPPRAPGAPRTGGVREIVFKVADDLWEKAGKPSDLKAVLELRKSMMSVLEAEHGVKRTTSSTTLGAWQKERIS